MTTGVTPPTLTNRECAEWSTAAVQHPDLECVQEGSAVVGGARSSLYASCSFVVHRDSDDTYWRGWYFLSLDENATDHDIAMSIVPFERVYPRPRVMIEYIPWEGE